MKKFTDYLEEQKAKTKAVSIDVNGKRKLLKSFKQYLADNEGIDKVMVHAVISKD
jgi:hypothetical protein